MKSIITQPIREFAGIGNREISKETFDRIAKISRGLNRIGYTLRSGGARGSDSAFQIAYSRSGNSLIYRPDDDIPQWAYDMAVKKHPAGHSLKTHTKKLMARNCMIILGASGNSPVDFVLCYNNPLQSKSLGGTGFSVQIARSHEIPVFNLWDPLIPITSPLDRNHPSGWAMSHWFYEKVL